MVICILNSIHFLEQLRLSEWRTLLKAFGRGQYPEQGIVVPPASSDVSLVQTPPVYALNSCCVGPDTCTHTEQCVGLYITSKDVRVDRSSSG